MCTSEWFCKMMYEFATHRLLIREANVSRCQDG